MYVYVICILLYVYLFIICIYYRPFDYWLFIIILTRYSIILWLVGIRGWQTFCIQEFTVSFWDLLCVSCTCDNVVTISIIISNIYIYIHIHIHTRCSNASKTPEDASYLRNTSSETLSVAQVAIEIFRFRLWAQIRSRVLSRVGLGLIDSIPTWFGISVSLLLRSSGPKTHAGPSFLLCIRFGFDLDSITFRFRPVPPFGDWSPAWFQSLEPWFVLTQYVVFNHVLQSIFVSTGTRVVSTPVI